jgi:hypothetical protein
MADDAPKSAGTVSGSSGDSRLDKALGLKHVTQKLISQVLTTAGAGSLLAVPPASL